jgi:hypothetical protein
MMKQCNFYKKPSHFHLAFLGHHNEHYKKHFSFSGLEVLYNYLLTLDEDIDFCEGAIVAEWDEFEDILDFQKNHAGN